jgi:hypothetical protein
MRMQRKSVFLPALAFAAALFAAPAAADYERRLSIPGDRTMIVKVLDLPDISQFTESGWAEFPSPPL